MNAPLPHHPTIITFASPEGFFEYIRGPAQHNAHLFAYWRAGGKTPYQKRQELLRRIAASATTPDRTKQ